MDHLLSRGGGEVSVTDRELVMAVSKRWEVIYFLFTAATVSYMLRVNICVCAQKMRDEFDWTDMQKGLVLSAFFWG